MYSLNGSTPEDVFGGVDLQGASFPLHGDFYCEADDVTRGVTLDACELSYHSPDNYQYDDVPSFLFHAGTEFKQKDLHLESDVLQQMPAKALGSSIPRPAFFEGDEAPSPPDDEFFQFELTTMVVLGMLAAQIANEIVDFLDKQVRTSWIKKVSRRKLTIKAEVCLEASHCEAKVRIYRRTSGGYSVEMQRRQGDVIAFNRLWKGVSEHLNSCMTSVGAFSAPQSTMPAVVEPIVPELPIEDGDSSVASVEPLLSLAGCSDPRLQAEAMLALAHAAQNSKVAAQLCTRQVFILLQKMSEAVCFNILEPLSRLVYLLSALPQARAFPEMQYLQESMKVVGFVGNSCTLVN